MPDRSSGTASPVAHLRITDELDLATTPVLRARVAEALLARPQTLALDLSECPFAGVDALETLVDLTAVARRQGTTLLLVGLRPILQQAIALLGLENVLFYGHAPQPRSSD